jgi:multidrug efflux pump subunit AcrA (membrane-fusion protein)
VPVGAMAGVTPGQRATVIPDGSATTLSGTVTSIAVMPLSSAGGGVTVPVTVAIDGGTTVPDGSTATVALLAGDAQGSATVVPTSAVISRGRGYAVQVDKDGTLTTVPVTIGASGPIYTQITGGLTAGQQVVLANLTTPLPTSTNLRGLVGGGGGGNRRGGGRGGG